MEAAKIRLIRIDELEPLLELYKHFDNGDPEQVIDGKIQALWEGIFHNPDLYYIVAEIEGQLVATCNVTIIKNLTRGCRPFGLIENVVTHKAYRGQGLGKLVLGKAVEIAKSHDCYKVMLLTGSKKEETLNFYRSAGFRDDIKTGFIMKL